MIGSGPPAGTHCRTASYAPERGGSERGGRAAIAVAVVDDRALFGESLATAVNAQAGDVVMSHWRYAQALGDLQTILRDADVVLVCIGRANLTKGSINQLLRALLREDAHPPVAVLADTVSPSMVRSGMSMGLGGMIASTAPLKSVISALRQIHSGATVLPNMN
ncbi:response regulator transcription factor [Azospirillum rugosum]|uniref:DNA-binding NarL/FixJ family response regulator n=1 Tax=Azospirillum rugosum TaxID=416170 RepID=A0ABS4SFV5_9PROT|nr:response regulator transcription factor [Azospirillum rugosum]MBP2291449.1 DNA-binding NarL/FixJ family response regulator [Azospirillum rugosum]MDQ0525237.1 DNA-binding NarL/FixJ family response regulator [Azospirillum rugosum]